MFKIFTKIADQVTWQLLNIESGSKLGDAVHFFIEDTTKIFVLLLLMIYFIAILRASINLDVVRTSLQGRSRFFGYIIGSIFGAITPFCSCSSIPMFLGFTSAKIPIGVTLSFLITSPLVNEVAIVLLGSILGWKFTVTYLVLGIATGILGGLFFDAIKSEKYLQPLVKNALKNSNLINSGENSQKTKMSLIERHSFAKNEAITIFSRIWKWVIIGVGAGAMLHGFVPDAWIATHLGTGAWWSVPLAVIMGIPLYSNASGMIPVIETLLAKGLPVGTALAFMMSTVGASFPEFLLLKQVLQPKLLLYLFGYFLVAFTTIGWIINTVF